MRLLRCSDRGDIALPEVFADTEELPQYAILSHTWEPDQEVTFKDLADGTGKYKNGYRKLRYCAEQAKADGLQYFWADTCCIDKSNAIELQKAINSMFRHYMHAKTCYVYLSDVSTLNDSNETAVVDIRSSRWFQRAWTLQELLAPTDVEFFSSRWERLGNTKSLQQQIHEATDLPITVLTGAPLYQFSDKQKFSWIESRKTTVEEDKAYALPGVFDVEMPLRYGEGAPEAFRRLKEEIGKLNACLTDLRLSDPCDDKSRIEESKGGLLVDVHLWILNTSAFRDWHEQPESRLLWVKGDPGKGKTMLLCGIIDELQRSLPRDACLSFFFCQATDLRINNATSLLRGLIYMLVVQQPALVSQIRKRYDHADKRLFEDENAWAALSEIFLCIAQDIRLKPTCLIVDALDECTVGLEKLLGLIVQTTASPHRVKWLISSRNEAHIEHRLESIGEKAGLSLELRNNAKQVANAVEIYIDHKLSCLPLIRENSRLRGQVRAAMVKKTSGSFLWVALVVQELEKPGIWDPLAVVEEVPPSLHQLYDRILKQIQQLEPEAAAICQSLLAVATVAYCPLSIAEMSTLCVPMSSAQLSMRTLRELIKMCGSFFTIRGSQIYLVHQSAKDFLRNAMQTKALPSQSETHYKIFTRSLERMANSLKRDMYDLVLPDAPVTKIEEFKHDPLVTVRYSCLYWVDHLCDAEGASWFSNVHDLLPGGKVDAFLRKHYLYWLESLSVCRSIGKGIISMERLCSLIQDMHIEEVPLRTIPSRPIYLRCYSAPLVAKSTPLRHEEPRGITLKPEVGPTWSACLLTLDGHDYGVKSISYSHDSARLLSSHEGRTVRIWDASSGGCLQTCKDHTGAVNSAVFSPDATTLASASDDRTIKPWNASGECMQTLKGHTSWVKTVVFAHDSLSLASASDDGTIKIWTINGVCKTLEGHNGPVTSIDFSHDSNRLASASSDRTVKVWDTRGALLHTFFGHTDVVNSVSFSPDQTKLASGSGDGTVRISYANHMWQTLDGHSGRVHSVAFSRDSSTVASASDVIKIWNFSGFNGSCLRILEGRNGPVYSIAWSHDSTRLASASRDGTIKIWDMGSAMVSGNTMIRSSTGSLQSHRVGVPFVALSPNSTMIASSASDGTKIWDATSCVMLQELKSHEMVRFSPDSTALAVVSDDHVVEMWDTRSGACLRRLTGHLWHITSVTFSPDSRLLASASWDRTVKIWNTSTGACLQTLEGHRDSPCDLSFSPFSDELMSASWNTRVSIVKLWDIKSGLFRETMEFPARMHEIDLDNMWKSLHSDKRLPNTIQHFRQGVSVSGDKIWITSRGQNLVWLPIEYRPMCSDGSDRRVVVGTQSGRVWTCFVGTN